MNSLLAVYRFEMKRILTPGRAFWWAVVAGFPVAITLMMRELYPSNVPPEEVGAVSTIILYFLAPSVACMLGVLLTAAPIIATELEQHSWIYLATRPNGLFHLVLGKYLVAVTWAATATVAGVLISVPISRIYYKFDALVTLSMISVASAFAYAALYLMIGTLFHARAMVFCVVYTAAIELFMGMFPAVINRMTVQFRLRSILYHGVRWPERITKAPEVTQYIASDEGISMQMLWLLTFTILFLCVSFVVVQVREFTTASESEL